MSTEEDVREACLQLLTVRQRSRAELEQRLRRKGFEDDHIAPVLDKLTEVELIDDQAFARTWVQSRHEYSGKGKRALAAELRLKGVADSVAAEALSHVDEESEELRARELVRKRLRTLTVDDTAAATRKLVGMLARRGYSQGLAFRVVSDELTAAGAATDEYTEDSP